MTQIYRMFSVFTIPEDSTKSVLALDLRDSRVSFDPPELSDARRSAVNIARSLHQAVQQIIDSTLIATTTLATTATEPHSRKTVSTSTQLRAYLFAAIRGLPMLAASDALKDSGDVLDFLRGVASLSVGAPDDSIFRCRQTPVPYFLLISPTGIVGDSESDDSTFRCPQTPTPYSSLLINPSGIIGESEPDNPPDIISRPLMRYHDVSDAPNIESIYTLYRLLSSAEYARKLIQSRIGKLRLCKQYRKMSTSNNSLLSYFPIETEPLPSTPLKEILTTVGTKEGFPDIILELARATPAGADLSYYLRSHIEQNSMLRLRSRRINAEPRLVHKVSSLEPLHDIANIFKRPGADPVKVPFLEIMGGAKDSVFQEETPATTDVCEADFPLEKLLGDVTSPLPACSSSKVGWLSKYKAGVKLHEYLFGGDSVRISTNRNKYLMSLIRKLYAEMMIDSDITLARYNAMKCHFGDSGTDLQTEISIGHEDGIYIPVSHTERIPVVNNETLSNTPQLWLSIKRREDSPRLECEIATSLEDFTTELGKIQLKRKLVDCDNAFGNLNDDHYRALGPVVTNVLNMFISSLTSVSSLCSVKQDSKLLGIMSACEFVNNPVSKFKTLEGQILYKECISPAITANAVRLNGDFNGWLPLGVSSRSVLESAVYTEVTNFKSAFPSVNAVMSNDFNLGLIYPMYRIIKKMGQRSDAIINKISRILLSKIQAVAVAHYADLKGAPVVYGLSPSSPHVLLTKRDKQERTVVTALPTHMIVSPSKGSVDLRPETKVSLKETVSYPALQHKAMVLNQVFTETNFNRQGKPALFIFDLPLAMGWQNTTVGHLTVDERTKLESDYREYLDKLSDKMFVVSTRKPYPKEALVYPTPKDMSTCNANPNNTGYYSLQEDGTDVFRLKSGGDRYVTLDDDYYRGIGCSTKSNLDAVLTDYSKEEFASNENFQYLDLLKLTPKRLRMLGSITLNRMKTYNSRLSGYYQVPPMLGDIALEKRRIGEGGKVTVECRVPASPLVLTSTPETDEDYAYTRKEPVPLGREMSYPYYWIGGGGSHMYENVLRASTRDFSRALVSTIFFSTTTSKNGSFNITPECENYSEAAYQFSNCAFKAFESMSTNQPISWYALSEAQQNFNRNKNKVTEYIQEVLFSEDKDRCVFLEIPVYRYNVTALVMIALYAIYNAEPVTSFLEKFGKLQELTDAELWEAKVQGTDYSASDYGDLADTIRRTSLEGNKRMLSEVLAEMRRLKLEYIHSMRDKYDYLMRQKRQYLKALNGGHKEEPFQDLINNGVLSAVYSPDNDIHSAKFLFPYIYIWVGPLILNIGRIYAQFQKSDPNNSSPRRRGIRLYSLNRKSDLIDNNSEVSEAIKSVMRSSYGDTAVHVPTDGWPCWGNAAAELDKYCKAWDYRGALQLIYAYLNTVNLQDGAGANCGDFLSVPATISNLINLGVFHKVSFGNEQTIVLGNREFNKYLELGMSPEEIENLKSNYLKNCLLQRADAVDPMESGEYRLPFYMFSPDSAVVDFFSDLADHVQQWDEDPYFIKVAESCRAVSSISLLRDRRMEAVLRAQSLFVQNKGNYAPELSIRQSINAAEALRCARGGRLFEVLHRRAPTTEGGVRVVGIIRDGIIGEALLQEEDVVPAVAAAGGTENATLQRDDVRVDFEALNRIQVPQALAAMVTAAEEPVGEPAEMPAEMPADGPAERPVGTPVGTPAEEPAYYMYRDPRGDLQLHILGTPVED